MRPVFLHAGILVVALAGAYAAWTAEPEDEREAAVRILDIEKEALREVRYHAKALDVRLVPKKDDLGAYVWVEVEKRRRKEAADAAGKDEAKAGGGTGEAAGAAGGTGGAGDGAKAADAPGKGAKTEDASGSGTGGGAETGAGAPEGFEVTERDAFKGNAAAEKIVAAAAPLAAKRRLDTSDAVDLAELGLDDPPAKLVVETADGAHEYELGDTVYGGDSRYLRDVESGQIYLVDARVLRPLMSPKTSLIDRRVFDGTLADWDRVTVATPEGTVTLVQHHRADRDAAFFSIGEADERSETAEAWLKKFLRLRARAYLSDPPDVGRAAPLLEVRLEGEGEPQTVAVYRIDGGADGGGESDAKERYVAKSTHTRGFVELYAPQARDALEDTGALVEPAGGAEGGEKAGEGTP